MNCSWKGAKECGRKIREIHFRNKEHQIKGLKTGKVWHCRDHRLLTVKQNRYRELKCEWRWDPTEQPDHHDLCMPFQ